MSYSLWQMMRELRRNKTSNLHIT